MTAEGPLVMGEPLFAVPGLIPPNEKEIVNFTFYNSIVQVSKNNMTCEYFCCCRCHDAKESIPRHKILGYDFTADEWWPCLTICPGCPCCCKNQKYLELGMMNGEKVILMRPKPGMFSNTDWPDDLPGAIKNYVFSPLDTVGDKAQLLGHMVKDGISKKAELELPLSGELPKPVMTSSGDTEKFQVTYGKKGSGRYSLLRFMPGYLSMEWGDNPRCGYPCCCVKNPCNVLSHDTVIPRFVITGYQTSSSDLCCGICSAIGCATCCRFRNLTLFTGQTIKYKTPLGFEVEVPVTYDFPISSKGDDFDESALADYVYGAVGNFGTQLHAVNHMIEGGLAEKLTITENVLDFMGGSPAAQEMQRTTENLMYKSRDLV